MAALTVSAVKPSGTISFSQRTRETSSGMLHAGSGSHHFSSASSETEARDARGFSRGRFTGNMLISDNSENSQNSESVKIINKIEADAAKA